MKNDRIIFFVSLLLGLPLFVYIVSRTNPSLLFDALRGLRPGWAAGYLAFSLVNHVVYTGIWHRFLTLKDVNVSPVTLFNYRLAGFALSYLTPGPRIGGEITRGRLVDADSTAGVTTAAAEKLVLLIASVVFNAAVICAAAASMVTGQTLSIVASIAALAIIACVAFYAVTGADSRTVQQFITTMLSEYESYIDDVAAEIRWYTVENKEAVLKAVIAATITKVFLAAQFYTLTAALNHPLGVIESFFLAATTDIAYSIPSYMGLGALDAGYAGLFTALKKSKDVGVLTALITRARDIALSGYGLVALTYYTGTTFTDNPE